MRLQKRIAKVLGDALGERPEKVMARLRKRESIRFRVMLHEKREIVAMIKRLRAGTYGTYFLTLHRLVADGLKAKAK